MGSWAAQEEIATRNRDFFPPINDFFIWPAGKQSTYAGQVRRNLVHCGPLTSPKNQLMAGQDRSTDEEKKNSSRSHKHKVEMVGPWDRNSSSELTFHGNKDEEFHERWVQERRLIRSGHRNLLRKKHLARSINSFLVVNVTADQ